MSLISETFQQRGILEELLRRKHKPEVRQGVLEGNVVVVVDKSEASKRAFEFTLAYIAQGSNLHLFHLVTINRSLDRNSQPAEVEIEVLAEFQKTAATGRKDLTINPRLILSRPGSEATRIMQHAYLDEIRANTIVVGSDSQNNVGQPDINPVAQKLLALAPSKLLLLTQPSR